MKKFDKTGKYDEINKQIKMFIALAGQMDINLLKEVVNDLQRDAAYYVAWSIVPDYYKEVDNRRSKYERVRKLFEFIKILYNTNDKIIRNE